GQASQGNPPQEQNATQDRALVRQLLRDAQPHQWNRSWNSGSNLLWRNVLGDPTSQNLTFAWVDAASRNSGLTLAPADSALRAHLNLAKDEGLIVTALSPGSPAFSAGIRQNDVLIRIGDETQKSTPLGKPQDLQAGLKTAG